MLRNLRLDAATGAILWQSPQGGNTSSQPMVANGTLYGVCGYNKVPAMPHSASSSRLRHPVDGERRTNIGPAFLPSRAKDSSLFSLYKEFVLAVFCRPQ